MLPWLIGTLALATTGKSATSTPRDIYFPSGFRVDLLEDHRYPVVDVVIGFGSGTAQAPSDMPQLAHLVEHLYFQRPFEGAPVWQHLRALGCSYNATTRIDTTTYQARCSADHLGTALQLMLGTLDGWGPELTDDDVDVEKRIVEAEWRMRFDEGWGAWNHVLQALFPPDHPYHLALDPNLEGTSTSAIQDFVAEHYKPDNAVLVIRGDIRREQLGILLGKHATPTWIHPDATEEHRKRFKARELVLFATDVDFDWFEDPDEPGEPIGQVASGDVRTEKTSPGAPTTVEPVVVRPHIGEHQVQVAWSLPGADYHRYWILQRVSRAASTEVRHAFGNDLDVTGHGCYTVAGEQASVLVCTLVHSPDAKQKKLARKLQGLFSTGWNIHRENRIRSVLAHKTFQSWKRSVRDTGGLDLTEDVALYLLHTNYPGYFAARFDDGLARAYADYVTHASDWMTPKRAATVYVQPDANLDDGGGVSIGPPGGDAMAVRYDHDLHPHPLPTRISKPLQWIEETPLEGGATLVKVPDPGSLPQCLVQFAHPPGYPEELSRVVDRFLGMQVLSDGTAWYRYCWATRVNDGKVHKIAAKVQSNRAVEVWRHASYWWNQHVWQQLRGTEASLGYLRKDWMALTKLDKSYVDDYVRTKFRASNARVIVGGTDASLAVIHEEGGLVDRLQKWWTSKPSQTPAPIEETWTGTLRGETLLFAGPPNKLDARVELICPVNVPEGTDAFALQELLEAVGSSAMWVAAREGTGLAYAPYASVGDAWGEPVLILRTDAAPSEIAGAHEALRSALKGISAVDETTLTVARRGAIASWTHGAASTWGNVWTTSYFFRKDSDPAGFAKAIAAIDAATLGKAVEGCIGSEAIAVFAPESVGSTLSEAGIEHTVHDWRGHFLSRIATDQPGLLKDEQQRLQRMFGETGN